MKQKKLMEVGKRYKGYGYLNEFGEFEFTPEDTGSRMGVQKRVKEGANYKVSTTNKYVLVHIRIKRPGGGLVGVKKLMAEVDEVLKIIMSYDL